jgi:predicted DNA-binding ribbon-helix-helix protein
MQSAVLKRSIAVAGHKTSVSLEDAFWNGLKEIAAERHVNLSELVAEIDAQRQHGNLSSALRLFVLDFYRGQLSQAKEGHTRTQGVRLPTLSQRAIVSLGSSRTDEVEEDRSGA